MTRRHRRQPSGRGGYQRSDRVNELLREILADELVRIDDDDLQFVTITGVDVDNELTKAVVYLSTLDLDEDMDLSLIERHAHRFGDAINSQARLRKTPRLEFVLDPGLRQGQRVEEILRGMDIAAALDASHDEEE